MATFRSIHVTDSNNQQDVIIEVIKVSPFPSVELRMENTIK